MVLLFFFTQWPFLLGIRFFLFYHITVNKVEIKNFEKINSSNNFFKISVTDLAMDNKI